MKAKKIIELILLLITVTTYAQKNDTIRIKPETVNTSVLKEGTHRYLVYFKMNKDATRTQTQFWTRKIARVNYNEKPAIEITQSWEDKDSIVHIVKSYADAKTMKPLYHSTWWKVQRTRNSPLKTVTETTVDFINEIVLHNGKQLTDADTAKQERRIWEGYKSSRDKYFLNWHSDLETFPVLPYKQGVTFIIPFYDPGTASGYKEVAYTVTSSAELTGYDNQKIACWLLVHEEKGNKEVFWVSKKTKEVLKLEQEVNGTIYRFKIKLSYSN
ncbi:MAG: hypothetical protein MUF68_08935 [Cyclobacteriaceae bacterium]|nr:hypothetical protein [Cyclobacteriaceae bacterium]